MTEQLVERREIELEVGETIIVGDYALTLLDVDQQQIFVRVDSDRDNVKIDPTPFEYVAD